MKAVRNVSRVEVLGEEDVIMTAVTIKSQGTDRSRSHPNRSLDGNPGRAGAFGDLLDGCGEAENAWNRDSGTGGQLNGQGRSGQGWESGNGQEMSWAGGDASSETPCLRTGAASESDSGSMTGSKGVERCGRSDRGQETERAGDRTDRRAGDEEKGDGDRPSSGVGGGGACPPSSPLAAVRVQRVCRQSGVSGAFGGGIAGLSAKARIQAFMVGKSGDGAASVRMEIALGQTASVALTVEEGTQAGAVRIVLSARDLADAHTAVLASDLLKHLQNHGISVQTVESSDGTELASGGNFSQGKEHGGTGEDEERMQRPESVEDEINGTLRPGLFLSGRRASRRLGLSDLTGFFG